MSQTQESSYLLIIFIIASVLLMLVLVTFIITIIYKYQKKQLAYFTEVGQLKTTHENELLKSQVEMQEQTFQNISREIHDNIGQKLTLAKLHLNTLNFTNLNVAQHQINNSVDIITEALNHLSDISRSMNTEIILNNGLIKALEFEVNQLQKSGLYKVELSLTGDPIFLPGETELVLFRIVQEVTHNIIKHAQATQIVMHLHYTHTLLQLHIKDNGKGFSINDNNFTGSGLKNMQKRTQLLKGTFNINSAPTKGTTVIIELPLIQNIPNV